jgi:SAM-dependent methyltransferase
MNGDQRQCIVCGGRLGPARGYPGLLSCAACTFVTADLNLADPELRDLYGEDYFHGKEYANYTADRAVAEKQFRIRLRTVLRHLPADRRGMLFEIGCAYGFFLAVARTEFRHVAGIDISPAAVAWARTNLGVDVVAGDFAAYDLTRIPDVVCMWDTVEHLARPDLYIEKLSRMMPAGSLLALTTGDIGSTVARLRGRKWRQIHPPTHLHYFSIRTMRTLLERHGFRIRYTGSEGMYRSLDSMAYILLRQKRSLPRLYAALRAAGLLKFDLYLNLYDIMLIIAERTEVPFRNLPLSDSSIGLA